jgi:HNH endonuclease
MITHNQLLKALSYDPDAGIFRWKWRDDMRKEVNTRWSGKMAGTLAHNGYWHIKINFVLYQGHQLAWFYMTGEWPKNQIDHENGNKADNAWKNLRSSSQFENMQNVVPHRGGTSKYLGVSWSKQKAKWQSQIMVNRKRHHLGFYADERDAAAAYLEAKKRLHAFQPVPRDLAA